MDLTEKKGQNEVTQHLRKTLVFKYTNYATSSTYMDLIVSGRRKNPTVTIMPKIKYTGKNNENNVNISIVKADATKYSNTRNNNKTDLFTTTLYSKGKFIKSINDQPNEIEISNKNHKVLYYVYAFTNEGSIVSLLKYEQNNIGLSSTELVLIILSIIFFITSIYILYISYKNYRFGHSGDELNKMVDDTKVSKLINEWTK